MKNCQCEGCKRSRMPESVGYQPCAGGPYGRNSNGLVALIVIVIVVGLFGFSLFVNPVHAAGLCDDDARVIAGGWSYHIDRSAENETHNAIGLQCDGWSALTFKNSNGDNAFALGREVMPWSRGSISWGGYGGAWFGYFPEQEIAFIPVIAARARWQPAKHFAVSLTSVVAVSTLHLEWSF